MGILVEIPVGMQGHGGYEDNDEFNVSVSVYYNLFKYIMQCHSTVLYILNAQTLGLNITNSRNMQLTKRRGRGTYIWKILGHVGKTLGMGILLRFLQVFPSVWGGHGDWNAIPHGSHGKLSLLSGLRFNGLDAFVMMLMIMTTTVTQEERQLVDVQALQRKLRVLRYHLCSQDQQNADIQRWQHDY